MANTLSCHNACRHVNNKRVEATLARLVLKAASNMTRFVIAVATFAQVETVSTPYRHGAVLNICNTILERHESVGFGELVPQACGRYTPCPLYLSALSP